MNIFFVPLYVATNFQQKIVHFQIVGLVVNIGLNLLLIPALSIVGAAMATVATEMSIFILIFYWIRKKLGVRLFPDFAYSAKVLLSTIIMMIFVAFAFWQNFHILLIVGAALLVYIVTLEVTNTLRFTTMARAIVNYKSGV